MTQSLWEVVMGNNPSSCKGRNFPVERISQQEIVIEFLPKLNAMTGCRFRLPTEEEWEYAARGGIHSHGYEFSGSNDLMSVGWNKRNSEQSPHPVGEMLPNELGLYDMTGNVWEWCDEVGKLRGGGWNSKEKDCKIITRHNHSPDDRCFDYGFRLVLVP